MGLAKFLLSGKPYQNLKRNLRSLLITEESLRSIEESAREFISLTMADRRAEPFISGRRRVLATDQDMALDLTPHIRAMAENLKPECVGTPQLDVAMFLEIYSKCIRSGRRQDLANADSSQRKH